MQLCVRKFDGTQYWVQISSQDTVHDLKLKVFESGGPPASQQTLIFEGAKQDDSRTMKHLNVQSETCFHLAIPTPTPETPEKKQEQEQGQEQEVNDKSPFCVLQVVEYGTGEIFSFVAAEIDTVASLKNTVIPTTSNTQTLFYLGKKLDNDVCLTTVVTHGSSLHITTQNKIFKTKEAESWTQRLIVRFWCNEIERLTRRIKEIKAIDDYDEDAMLLAEKKKAKEQIKILEENINTATVAAKRLVEIVNIEDFDEDDKLCAEKKQLRKKLIQFAASVPFLSKSPEHKTEPTKKDEQAFPVKISEHTLTDNVENNATDSCVHPTSTRNEPGQHSGKVKQPFGR